jgi:20S proteasome alpha/beta subunit
MAGDGRATRGSLVGFDEAVKVFRLSDGSLLGGAGQADAVNDMRVWIDNGCIGKRPKTPDVAMLHLRTEGECLVYFNNGSPTQTGLPTAIGSGDHLAIGAMEAGASPEQAVAISARRDVNTGGKVSVLHLKPRARAIAPSPDTPDKQMEG